MAFKMAFAVCLVLWLLVNVDDVSSRPTGVRRDVDRLESTPVRVQTKDPDFGPVRGSERVPNTGDRGSVQKQNGGLKEFLRKTIQHFKRHAPPATVYALPVSLIAISLLCCVTCAIDRPVPLEGGF
ncbi:hypothetical protein AMELA_G00211050 [Ameiurus melas]|uniref:Uncharacterized protein n=1 Tax=Ameiurus melas TaxID=219545 RepID=A0A7J6A4L1_AMEME|nr:hypothetical protein AMELA_G00211050 [Ameiurus melas]